MTEDINNTPEAQTEAPEAAPQEQPKEEAPSRANERITELSGKVAVTSKERDEALQKATEAENRAKFAEDFAEILGTQPEAKNFKEAIQEKVKAGYSIEDAATVVLAKEGKLTQGDAPAPVEPQSPAGGSADTVMTQDVGDKPISEMTLDEKRAELSKHLVIE